MVDLSSCASVALRKHTTFDVGGMVLQAFDFARATSDRRGHDRTVSFPVVRSLGCGIMRVGGFVVEV